MENGVCDRWRIARKTAVLRERDHQLGNRDLTAEKRCARITNEVRAVTGVRRGEEGIRNKIVEITSVRWREV